MQDRDVEADRAEQEEDADAQAEVLHAAARQEGSGGNIDDEGAEHIVELPLRAGLQLVVAVDAALLARQRGIERAEKRLPVERHETRLWDGLRLPGEALDRLRHVVVGGR